MSGASREGGGTCSALPHDVQNRLSGVLTAPQRTHGSGPVFGRKSNSGATGRWRGGGWLGEVAASGAAGTCGGAGTSPCGGVAGADSPDGASRVPQSAQKRSPSGLNRPQRPQAAIGELRYHPASQVQKRGMGSWTSSVNSRPTTWANPNPKNWFARSTPVPSTHFRGMSNR